MARVSQPDLAAAERAVADLLRALAIPSLDADPELRETPARVARLYAEELLDGYGRDPATVLSDGVASDERGLVVLSNARYASVCPHHMLPSEGVVSVGYLPAGRVVGLGTLVRLVEVFAHRLVLQETLGRQIAEALVAHLGARGAAVHLRARHQCLAARGEKQGEALFTTTAYAGSFERDEGARVSFLHAALGPVPGAPR